MKNTKPASSKGWLGLTAGLSVIIVGLLVLLCIAGGILVYVFRDDIFGKKSTPQTTATTTPTPAPAPAPAPDATGTWKGTYRVTSPSPCAGVHGTWSATLVQKSGKLTGTYSSSAGLSGSVKGSISGSSLKWNVGGSGMVDYSGTINGSKISGTFVSVTCTRSTGRARGTFTGNKQ